MKRIAVCLLSLLTLTAVAADLNMLTDNHPPLHFRQGDQLVGFGVDVVQALADMAGDQVHFQQVRCRAPCTWPAPNPPPGCSRCCAPPNVIASTSGSVR